MQRSSLVLLLLLGATLPAQTATLTSREVLRVHFVIPGPPAPQRFQGRHQAHGEKAADVAGTQLDGTAGAGVLAQACRP